jgi:hypothetical protein
MASKRLLAATFGTVVLAGVLYFAIPAVLLHWRLDRLVFASQSHDITHESQSYEIGVGNAANIIVRRYGGSGGFCVFFFPGQHGGVGTYERTLFPYLREIGTTIYSVSYPGQDGTRGQGSVAQLPDQVESAVRTVARAESCNLDQSVFIGRSLGATVALLEAERIRPAGVVVDGLAADLSVVIRAWIDRHPMLRGWNLLPIKRILGPSLFPITPLLTHLTNVRIVVFQGTADDVTAFLAARSAVQRYANITFRPVPGGRHNNSYILARPEYLKAIQSMTGTRTGHGS